MIKKKAYLIGTNVSESLSPLIFNYWFEANPEDYNPDIHGGGGDPSDTIMDELEGWFEDKDDDQKTFDAEFKAADDRIKRDALADDVAVEETYPGWGPYPGYGMPKTHPKHPSRKKKNEGEVNEWSDKETTAAAKRDSKKVQRTGTHANRKWAVGEGREDGEIVDENWLTDKLKAAGTAVKGGFDAAKKKSEADPTHWSNASKPKAEISRMKTARKMDKQLRKDIDNDNSELDASTLLGSKEGAPTIDDLARMLKLAGV